MPKPRPEFSPKQVFDLELHQLSRRIRDLESGKDAAGNELSMEDKFERLEWMVRGIAVMRQALSIHQRDSRGQ